MKKKDKRIFLLGLLPVPLILLLLYLPLIRELDVNLADRIYQTGYSISENRIVIVAIDEETLNHLGNIGTWDRGNYATLLNQICTKDSSPSVVGIDVEFPGPYNGDEHDIGDADLVDAVASSPNLILANHLVRDRNEVDWAKSLPTFEQMEAAGNVSWGYTNLFLDSLGLDEKDAIVRHMVHEYRDSYHSFAYEVARKAGLAEAPDYLNRGEYLMFAGKAETTSDRYGTSFEKVSFWSVYNGEVNTARFRDKIVLIGAYETGLQDEYPTAIDHAGRMAGVEIQANMINALLDPAYPQIRELADWIQVAAVLVLLLVLYSVFAIQNLPVSLAFWGVLTGSSIPFALLIKSQGYLIHPIWFPISLTLLCIWGILLHYYRISLQKTEIRMRFGRYVDESVLQKILQDMQDGAELGRIGENREAAVLFADICGFTGLSEKKKPEEIVELLNRYFEIITESAGKYHGTIDKFIGDAAMIVWNAPENQEDFIHLALKAAEEIVKRIQDEPDLAIQVAIGIDCGTVVVGNIGSSRRMDYTVIGDPVNTASRLESLKIPGRNRGNQIYISEQVVKKMKNPDSVQPLGSFQVRGKEKPVKVFRIV